MDKKIQVKMDGKTDILQGKWHELKGQVKQQWGKLTDDDMAKMSGKREELSGALQQRYGYDREVAEMRWDEFIRLYDDAAKKDARRAANY